MASDSSFVAPNEDEATPKFPLVRSYCDTEQVKDG